MHCPSCGSDNPEGTKFCGECGVPIQPHCPQCGFENLPSTKFCRQCGASLKEPPSGSASRGQSAGQALPVAPRAAVPSAAEGERRQLTVMFCDLVGSTALSAQLDPEDLRQLVRQYQQTCAEVIERFGGHIAQYLGDGLLVYFGYPVAHEDDAARAVRVGLGIIEALCALKTHLTRPLQVRIGIHTGLVVVGEMGGGHRQEQLALGETPNLAARIQGQAAPDEVIISAVTYHLIKGLFACEDRGQPELKGIPMPLTLYRVEKESEALSRFDVTVQAGLTPLVGREEELGLLRRCWKRALDGEGQVVLLSGEPGIGKSRLVQTVKDEIGQEQATRIEFRCSPYHQHSAFYPLIDHLHRLLQFAPHDTPQARLATLQQTLAPYRFPRADTLPLLAALLSLPHPEGALPLTLSPQKQKQKTQEALVAWVVEEAERAPVYCAWEDLHWADPSTLEVLTLVLDQVPTTRLLVLLTFRPEFTPPWSARSYLTQLMLSRLGRPQVEAMVGQVTGGKALPPEVVRQILAKTDGVPLFVEELTKMVLESGLVREEEGRYVGVYGSARTPSLTIPSTLQDSLMARLDRLAPVREIAQVGAVLGREFSYDLLHAVSPLDEGSLQQGLRQLVEAELIYQRGLPPQASYLFKHALIQDTAYQSLLKSKRQQCHQQIAQVLEGRFPDTKETQPELLAHHYTEAGLVEQAISYWQQAGQRAAQRSASVEAVHHLSQGLELLKTLPDTPERAQQELRFQIALGPALTITRGYAAPEVESAYTRARKLCQQSGETTQLFPVLVGLHRFYQARGEIQIAHELGEQCLTLAQHAQDPILLVEAHRTMGTTLYFLGEFTPARAHLEQGIARHDPQRYRSLASSYVLDPGVSCLSYVALTLWFLGYPEQAVQRSQEVITVAHALSHPFSLGIALVFAALLHQLRQEVRVAQEQAETGLALSSAQSSVPSLAHVMTVRGWALSEQGQGEAGIREICQGIATWRATGAEVQATHLLALLAETYGKVGQAEEGLNVLSEALSLIHKTGECNYKAELYRLKGTLTLQSQASLGQVKAGQDKPEDTDPRPLTPDPQAEAEACFLKAIAVAQHQQAKSLELRAAISLSRLWQQQGKKEEARQLLAEIYDWFTEGFDTRDLQEAKALLAALA